MSSNSGTSNCDRPCHPHIVDGGFPQRGEQILHREKNVYPSMISRLMGKGKGSFKEAAVLTMNMLEEVFSSPRAWTLRAACFLAGRCQPDQLEDQEKLTTLLQETLSSLPVEDLRSMDSSYIEAAMSLALRGEPETAKQALRPLVTGESCETTHDYLAAFYLAQLGDPSGYPVMLKTLQNGNEHYRLMATRHLIGFQPYDGQTVDGHRVNIKAALMERLDDSEDYVQVEVPFLMAEAEIIGLREILQSFLKKNKRKKAAQSARQVLEDLKDWE